MSLNPARFQRFGQEVLIKSPTRSVGGEFSPAFQRREQVPIHVRRVATTGESGSFQPSLRDVVISHRDARP